jgi:hypothetical protein
MRRLSYHYLVMIDGSLVVSLLGLDVSHIHEQIGESFEIGKKNLFGFAEVSLSHLDVSCLKTKSTKFIVLETV